MEHSKKKQTATNKQHSPELLALVKLLARAAAERDYSASEAAEDDKSPDNRHKGEESA